jgi:hypothetical protein
MAMGNYFLKQLADELTRQNPALVETFRREMQRVAPQRPDTATMPNAALALLSENDRELADDEDLRRAVEKIMHRTISEPKVRVGLSDAVREVHREFLRDRKKEAPE